MPTPSGPPQRLFAASIALSAALSVGLVAAYLRYHSELALAHAADSIADMVTASGLWLAVRISVAPADDEHPVGHHSAQPIAALMVAVLTSLLAVGVAREAIMALLGTQQVRFDWPLAAVIASKLVAKGILATLASRHLKQKPSAALTAFQLDARNDVLMGALSLVGFAAARFADLTTLDAWLALPIALLIGVSGVQLALESIQPLMASAAPEERHRQLRHVIEQVDGVIEVAGLRAMHHGDGIQVWAEVHVNAALSVGAAHRISCAVEASLRALPDVVSATVQMNAASETDKP